METFQPTESKHVVEVPNKANLWAAEEAKPESADIHKELLNFWSNVVFENSQQYYKEGYLQGQSLSAKSGMDALRNMIIAYISLIKKFMRDSDVPLSKTDKKLLDMLADISLVLNENTIGSVPVKDAKLINENVIAYFQGITISQYAKLKETYE